MDGLVFGFVAVLIGSLFQYVRSRRLGSEEQSKTPPWKWAAEHPWGAAAVSAGGCGLLILALIVVGMERSSGLALASVIIPVIFVMVGVHNSLAFKDLRRKQ